MGHADDRDRFIELMLWIIWIFVLLLSLAVSGVYGQLRDVQTSIDALSLSPASAGEAKEGERDG